MADSDSDPTWQPYWMPKTKKTKKRDKIISPIILRRFLKADGTFSWKIVSKPRHLEPSSKERLSSFGYCSDTSKSPIPESLMSGITCPIDGNLIASIKDSNIDISPFEPGEFIIEKLYLGEKYPPFLWRIGGKTILQKFEPFELDGKIVYKSMVKYAGFCIQNRHLAKRALVKICQQSRFEATVEFLDETGDFWRRSVTSYKHVDCQPV